MNFSATDIKMTVLEKKTLILLFKETDTAEKSLH